MDNISLVISGNLTGFSRFYASPTANDLLNEAKFDFDYRNYLTFLNSGDKAYAISFAPSVLAVSLVTRILDSFRRPGVLVVTLLLPRKSKVESSMNPQNKNALYQLLNEIYDKFHEKNFINGMLNQNAAVLMQDYYTEILGNYVLASDGMQRDVNANIEVASPNKRTGYVQTSEDKVPLYLASPCRCSYEGCHHVFFAQNPVQNLIAEEPVEVVYYCVKITNNGQILPSVRLSDKIPNVRPGEGEIDIDKNFTYQQVLNGEAGRNIVADLSGQTIEITYRFGLEEKSIKFVFTEGGKEIPFTSILPVLESNETEINIPSETCTFFGKEIYGPKRIKSRGTEYRIKRGSENQDLRRLQDTCIIEVEHWFSVKWFFNNPDDKPKRIIFKNNHGQLFQYSDVKSLLEAELPGYQEDYSYTIESLHYERATGSLSSFGAKMQIPPLKPVKNASFVPKKETKTNVGPTQQQGGYATSNVYDGKGEGRSNGTIAYPKDKQPENALQVRGATIPEPSSRHNEEKILKVAPHVIGALCVVIAYFLLAFAFNWPPFSESTGGSVAPSDSSSVYEQPVKIQLEDSTGDPLRVSDFNDFGNGFDEFSSLVDVILQDGSGQSMEPDYSEVPSDEIWYRFKLRTSGDQNVKYTFQLRIRQVTIGSDVFDGIVIGSHDFSSDDFSGNDGNVYDIKIKLDIKTSELLAYKKALDSRLSNNELSQDEIKNISKTAQNLQDSGRCNEFSSLISKLIKPAEEEAKKKDEENAKKKAEKEAKEKEKRRAEEDEKKNTEKNNKSSRSDADDILPDGIAHYVHSGNKVAKSLFKNLPENQKTIIFDYNKWVDSEYEQMKKPDWKKQKDQIDAQLKIIKKFSGVQAISKIHAFRPQKQ